MLASDRKTASTNQQQQQQASDANKDDCYKKFQGDGVQFKAKLIGSELVVEPRGDQICQDSIQRLKAIIRGQKAHKRRIVMKISYAGVRVLDEKTSEQLYHNEVSQISFIASDDTDARTFGYICDCPAKAHRFICFKTPGPATQVMSVISSLFEAVLEQKKRKASSESKEEEAVGEPAASAEPHAATDTAEQSGADKSEKELGSGGAAPSSLTGELASVQEQHFAAGVPPGPVAAFGLLSEQLGDLFGAGAQQQDEFEKQLKLSATTLVGPATFGGHHQGSALVKQSTLKCDSFGGADSGILDSPGSSFVESQAADWVQAPVAVAGPARASPVAQQQQQPTASRPINLQRPPARRQPHNQAGQLLSTSVAPATNFMLADLSDDPFAAPPSRNPPSQNNRSLVYNHSSVSLNEAALTRHSSSFGGTSLQPAAGVQQHKWAASSASGTDKYAVFNDIDNLPSIFESSTSLNSSECASKPSPTGEFSFQLHQHQQHQRQPMMFAGPRNQQQQQQAAADSFFSASTGSESYFACSGQSVPSNAALFAKQTGRPSLFHENNNNNGGSMTNVSQHQQHQQQQQQQQQANQGFFAFKSAGSASGLSRQANPFDDDFFI